MMTKTGQVVRLKVAKRAVLYHNLGSLLSQPSPTSQRGQFNVYILEFTMHILDIKKKVNVYTFFC